MTQIEVIRAVFYAQNNAKLESLTQEQKDAFILEKLNKANDALLDILCEVDRQFSCRLERIRAELTLGVEVPGVEKRTAEGIMAFIKPSLENMVECRDKLREHQKKEDAEYQMHLHEIQPQPIKPFSRS